MEETRGGKEGTEYQGGYESLTTMPWNSGNWREMLRKRRLLEKGIPQPKKPGLETDDGDEEEEMDGDEQDIEVLHANI